VPAQVATGTGGQPVHAGVRGKSCQEVVEIQETWRVDEGWWRPKPISRLYYRLVLSDGQRLTVYRDLVGGGWWAQRY
jgi:hypothetical protein